MPSESQADPTGEFAKELARQLPVKAIYKDVAAPAAKQTGQLLEDIVKTIQLALAPLQVLGAYQDRLRNFINKSVRRVPSDNRISPPPQILGPVVEGVRYELEGTPIDEMFFELLSRSMDSERVNEAHPAFPFIIKQLSSDEAKVLRLLKLQQYDYTFTRDYDRKTNLFVGAPDVEVDALPREDLTFPNNVPFYMQHLNQLGLAGIFQVGNQEPLFGSEPRAQTGVRAKHLYRLTELGTRFVTACIQD